MYCELLVITNFQKPNMRCKAHGALGWNIDSLGLENKCLGQDSQGKAIRIHHGTHTITLLALNTTSFDGYSTSRVGTWHWLMLRRRIGSRETRSFCSLDWPVIYVYNRKI